MNQTQTKKKLENVYGTHYLVDILYIYFLAAKNQRLSILSFIVPQTSTVKVE